MTKSFFKKNKLALLAASVFAVTAAGCSANSVAAASTPTPATEHHSVILNGVLTEKTYTDLIGSYTGNGDNPLYYSFPYAFLQSVGIDSERYRNGEKSCFCSAYVEKGERTLNFSLRAESYEKSTVPYYLCYTVAYGLNEQEYGEYELLHNGNYIEAPFFVQELAERKSARILSQTKISKESYETIYRELQGALEETKSDLDILGTTSTGVSVMVRTSCTDKITDGTYLTVQADSATPPANENGLIANVSAPLKIKEVSQNNAIRSFPCSFRRFEKTLG